MRDGSSEQREDPVTGEVFHGSVEGLDHADHPRDRVRDDELQLLRVEPFSKGSRAHEVGEESGHDPPLLPRTARRAHARHCGTLVWSSLGLGGRELRARVLEGLSLGESHDLGAQPARTMVDVLTDVGRGVVRNVDSVNVLEKLAEPLVERLVGRCDPSERLIDVLRFPRRWRASVGRLLVPYRLSPSSILPLLRNRATSTGPWPWR
jgi:hypothetical protein